MVSMGPMKVLKNIFKLVMYSDGFMPTFSLALVTTLDFGHYKSGIRALGLWVYTKMLVKRSKEREREKVKEK